MFTDFIIRSLPKGILTTEVGDRQICFLNKDFCGHPFPLPPRNACQGLGRWGPTWLFLASRVRQNCLGGTQTNFEKPGVGQSSLRLISKLVNITLPLSGRHRYLPRKLCKHVFAAILYFLYPVRPERPQGPFRTVFFHLGLGLSLNMEVQEASENSENGPVLGNMSGNLAHLLASPAITAVILSPRVTSENIWGK